MESQAWTSDASLVISKLVRENLRSSGSIWRVIATEANRSIDTRWSNRPIYLCIEAVWATGCRRFTEGLWKAQRIFDPSLSQTAELSTGRIWMIWNESSPQPLWQSATTQRSRQQRILYSAGGKKEQRLD